MNRATLCALVVPFLLATHSAFGQSASIHEEIQRTYNFQPHLLSHQETTQKSAMLDQFWTKAKSEPSIYMPALRQELGDFKNPPFFLYDGSMLLLSLSNTPADRTIRPQRRFMFWSGQISRYSFRSMYLPWGRTMSSSTSCCQPIRTTGYKLP